jgi:hypothetical protein
MKQLTLEQRYNKLDDVMKMYFKQEVTIFTWDRIADEKNKRAKEFNKNKHWWQRRQRENFPYYMGTPIPMPLPFPIPPVYHPQYEEVKELIKAHKKDVLAQI